MLRHIFFLIKYTQIYTLTQNTRSLKFVRFIFFVNLIFLFHSHQLLLSLFSRFTFPLHFHNIFFHLKKMFLFRKINESVLCTSSHWKSHQTSKYVNSLIIAYPSKTLKQSLPFDKKSSHLACH